jgi:L-threonylcarbamoyladenylate synthase
MMAHPMADAAQIAEASAELKAGRLVVFPTETVYGLGADARNEQAVKKIYALKGRPLGHPLIVHLESAQQMGAWADTIPALAWELAEAFWPGPMTLILRRASHVSSVITGGQTSVGLRVPAHPVAQALLHAFGGGIAAPSANRYGRVSPTRTQHVRDEFAANTPLMLEGGACEIGLESTIISLLDEPLLLRPGGIARDTLEAVTGSLRSAHPNEGPRASGTTLMHYAPATPLRWVSTDTLRSLNDGTLAVLARRPAPLGFAGHWIEASSDPVRYAHDLYEQLRQLDHVGARTILIETVPHGSAWEAICDRVNRAVATHQDISNLKCR